MSQPLDSAIILARAASELLELLDKVIVHRERLRLVIFSRTHRKRQRSEILGPYRRTINIVLSCRRRSMWKDEIIAALILCGAPGLYIHFRWQRAPQAYRAMVAIAVGCLAAGVMLCASIEHCATPARAVDPILPTAAIAPAAALAVEPPLSATVTQITDGDTINAKLSDGFEHSIRLAGIDAPESSQAFGAQSTADRCVAYGCDRSGVFLQSIKE